MTDPIYKIGDVLSYPSTASTYLILALKEVNIADNACQYKCLKTRKCYCDDAQIVLVSEFFFVKTCNRVGHIDISWLTGEPDAKPKSGRYKWGEYESFNDEKTKAGFETFNPDDYNLFDGDLAFKTCEEPKKKKWNLTDGITDEDWPEIKKSLEEAGMIVETLDRNDDGIRATCTFAEKDICDEYDALEAKVKKLTDECESLRNNLKDAAEAYNRQTACHEAWKRGWHECLKSFNYYLGTNEDNEEEE